MEIDSTAISSSSRSTDNTTTDSRVIRSSARVRAAKKEKEENLQGKPFATTTTTTAADDQGTTRKRARRSTTTALVINEPVRDPKGKKREAPEPDSDEEQPPSKKAKTSAYSLRSRKSTTNTTTNLSKLPMTRKSRSTSKAKATRAAKTKALSDAPGPSTPHEDIDIDMVDAEDLSGGEDDEEEENEQNGDSGEPTTPAPAPTNSNDSGGVDETALSMFGDYHSLSSYMLTLSSRLKTILSNIKPKADPTTRLLALQELSEILSMGTEDTLSGYFQVDSFVKELVRIMGGPGGEGGNDDGEDGESAHDEDAALAAALAMSSGGLITGDESLEAQMLACRCLANLMEALPGCAHTVVYHGAVPVLCGKLLEIQYIDLAEQTLSTLEKISEEYPSAIVREGGLGALLNYLDFFSTNVQRTALQAAANCCRNASSDNFNMIRDVFPIIRTVLGYSDQRLVEFACLCVIRTIESFHRNSSDLLESLFDTELIRAINLLLLPAAGSPLISVNTFTLFLRGLATASKASPKITLALLEADIVDTLYQILTGVLPPTQYVEMPSDGQGLGGGLADMAVMQNLGHRPKDQVEEALSLISELMPPLPKDSVFDHRSYTEKALARMIKAKAKADRPSRTVATSATPTLTPQLNVAEDPTPGEPTTPAPSHSSDTAESSTAVKEPPVNRTTLLRSKPEIVGRFMQLMVPILVDVYAASVALNVRTKSLFSLLKATSFLDGVELQNALKNVPVASFAGSILSSKDHPTLIIGILQFVELVLIKLPAEYKPSLRREGVLHEIENVAEQELTPKPKPVEPSSTSGETSEAPTPSPAKKASSVPLDPRDAIVIRSRVMKFKYLTASPDSEGDATLETLRSLVSRLSTFDAAELSLRETLKEIANLFSSPNTSISSFELLKSGLVDGLLEFATLDDWTIDSGSRQQLLLEVFSSSAVTGTDTPSSQTPLATLVKKLQESLTRMESFEVVTVSNGVDDSKRNAASMLARQIRLRLVAEEGSDIPKNCSTINVSIHAIATFQALNDYLRPRVAGLIGSGSRLSGIMAALAGLPRAGSSLSPLATSALAVGTSKDVSEPPVASSSSSAPPPASTSTAEAKSDGRRRSMRLSSKNPPPPQPEPVASTSEARVESSSAIPAMLLPNLPLMDVDDQDEFIEEEFDTEVFQDEMDPEPPAGEMTVSVAIADDGSHVEAQTPHGTRVATPTPVTPARPPSPSKPSYASALKTRPSDWHLEFTMDDLALPLDLTVYGAVHQHEVRRTGSPSPQPNAIWSGVFTVKFKKVPGLPPLPNDSDPSDVASRASSPALASLPEDQPHSKILRLLRVFYKLNIQVIDQLVFEKQIPSLPESCFINNKLTAKLSRQLEEPMIVASSCLPDWALDLPQHFPFLFPFTTRYSFLQSTSFGYARLISKWQSQQVRTSDSSRRDDGFGFLGRLQRQKVRISRKHVLESAIKVFELYGSSSSVLEVEYFEEVGTGLGPTLEFYSLVSREFARRDLKIWRDADTTHPGLYVHHPTGLFPAPFKSSEKSPEGLQKRIAVFKVLGQFVAKALLDSRIIDISFNKIFMKMILGEEVPLTLATLRAVDPTIAMSLSKLQNYAATRCQIQADDTLPPKEKEEALSALSVSGVPLEDLGLDFTVPGYAEIELQAGGSNISVDANNVEDYVQLVINALVGQGVQEQARAFRQGFSKVFPIADLQTFSADELMMLFGNADEDWTVETLSEALKADHGFNVESRAIRDLVEIMSAYDAPARRDYLQFITGSPKLPIGGFRGLNPPLTVVRKPHEAPLAADDYLPSVMTCVNYLKLPEYSSRRVMQEKLRVAMKEGVGSFHLS